MVGWIHPVKAYFRHIQYTNEANNCSVFSIPLLKLSAIKANLTAVECCTLHSGPNYIVTYALSLSAAQWAESGVVFSRSNSSSLSDVLVSFCDMATCGKPIDHTPPKYLNIVHIDIAFGDCLLIGGYKYALFLLIVLLGTIGALVSILSTTMT